MAMSSTPHPRPEPLTAAGTSNDGVLPQDLLYEILLRLPDKLLCRFRAVCTSWRSLLCDRDFIADHQNHHPPKPLAVGMCGYGQFHFVAMDMDTGCVITSVSTTESTSMLQEMLPAVSPERAVCVVGGGMDKRACLMDFATGALSFLPDHAMPRSYTAISYALGQAAASTGEYKVLAIAKVTLQINRWTQREEQVCKILTLTSDGLHHWRETESPRCKVVLPSYNRETTVIEGVAYFLTPHSEYHPVVYTHNDWIMAFNLDTEAWRPAPIRGPVGWKGVGLAKLDGHLAAFYDDRHTCVKLWSLDDPDNAIWSMLHQIVMPYHRLPLPSPLTRTRYNEFFEKPLAVLGDGRIVLWMRVPEDTVLRIYDPRTGAFTDGTRVPNCHNMVVHKCSMLYTGRGGAAKYSLPYGLFYDYITI